MDLISHKTNKAIVDNFFVNKKTIRAHHKLVEKNNFWSVIRICFSLIRQWFQQETDIVWRNVIGFIILHVMLAFSIYKILTGQVSLQVFVLSNDNTMNNLMQKGDSLANYVVLGLFHSFGITAGAHRLWTHRSYKATWQLRLFLMILNTSLFQDSIYAWSRNHRIHHKYTETNADPHNASRGLFFSHIGWVMVRKHPDVAKMGKNIDMSDLRADPIVMFQHKHYLLLMPLFTFILPIALNYYILGETYTVSLLASITRWMGTLHVAFCVNSFAHYAGAKPYDKNIAASNNTWVGIGAIGEGWHNYHHVFPWDYKTSELGDYNLNLSCMFIDFFAKIGWAYELKTVSEDVIKKRAERTGEGLPYKYTKCVKIDNQLFDDVNGIIGADRNAEEYLVWGWDDEDLNYHDRECAIITK